MSGPSFDLFDSLRHELNDNDTLRALRDSIAERGAPWRIANSLILHGVRIFIPAESALLPTVVEQAHSTGHKGFQKMLHRLRAEFYIEHDRSLVHDWVRACSVCQRNKVDSL